MIAVCGRDLSIMLTSLSSHLFYRTWGWDEVLLRWQIPKLTAWSGVLRPTFRNRFSLSRIGAAVAFLDVIRPISRLLFLRTASGIVFGAGSISRVIVLINAQQPPPSTPNDAEIVEKPAEIPSEPVKLVNFDDFSIEEIDDALEPVGPADVDNDVIQKLVDKFLNEGTLEEKKDEKVNKEAQKLVNSSPYWETANLKPEHSIKDSKLISDWLVGYNEELEKVLQQVNTAAWNYFTAASPLTKQYLDEAEDVARQFLKAAAKQSIQFDPEMLESVIEKKELSIISEQGINVLPPKDLNKYNNILSKINKLYTTTDVCEQKDQKMCITKYSDLISTIQTTSNPEKALNIWKAWRAAVGANLTTAYDDLVKVTNQAAKANGFEDAGKMWKSAFDDKFSQKERYDISENAKMLYQQVLPFYSQLHAYFRRQLAGIYKDDKNLKRDVSIPVYLLRSGSGEDWSNLYDETKPFDQMDTTEDEVMENLHKQNVTARNMFVKAFKFMKYLGFENLPKTFWTHSVFTRNYGKEMICNPAAAYDMLNGTDYRVKMCAQTVQSDFTVAHKLLAQLYYKILSKDQPLILRDAPSQSLSTAVAGAFGILAQNADYLKSQKLIQTDYRLEQYNLINRLYRESLSDFVKLPFNIVADEWRYQVFNGSTDSSKWSDVWWNLRNKYQGVSAPKEVDEAKYDAVIAPEIVQQHAPASRHVVSYIAQFQILKALCGANSTLSDGCVPEKNAADKLMFLMKKGASISWLDVLEELTGQRKLDAQPLLEYYEPLLDWLRRANEQSNVFIGWNGEGEAFAADEIPVINMDSGKEKPAIPSDDQIAYPGQDCSRGQECLLDSSCNGTICACNDGLFTLQIADTYNCVPSDPSKAGFTDGDGGLVIALNPNERKGTRPSSDPDEIEAGEVKKEHKADEKKTVKSGGTLLLASPLTIGLICLLRYLF
ncbi:unnamed protein product [Bursaphelenchus xylophilus]|uniref:Angiotensin-converting enzyme n=1 Tax=Bursaphelenchus xylophilus TaxID=6326 RepID=A0A1I7SU71_BURXY|nr:unnamed protein product [Bursaphelenchus xylophilus]CAG9107488.1 unnamed protein product [Bursaphelenchus xylophilus]